MRAGNGSERARPNWRPADVIRWVASLALAMAASSAAHAALISEAQEVALGRQAASELERQVGVVNDPALVARINRVGILLVRQSTRPRLPWTFRVLATREVNAVSLPGGFIYVTRGLVGFAQDEAELAFVLAHEVAHVQARHHVQLVERELWLSLLVDLLLGKDSTAAAAGHLLRQLATRGFSREFEYEADRLAVRLMRRAGYDPQAAVRFLERLRAREARDPGAVEVLLRTHPGLGDRVRRVREEVQRLGRVPARHGSCPWSGWYRVRPSG